MSLDRDAEPECLVQTDESKVLTTAKVKPTGVNVLALLESKSRTGMFASSVPRPQPVRTLTL